MATILTAAIFLAVAFAFMAGALAFAQFKKKQQSCCGDALEIHERAAVEDSSCFTCPRRKKMEKGEKDHATASAAEQIG